MPDLQFDTTPVGTDPGSVGGSNDTYEDVFYSPDAPRDQVVKQAEEIAAKAASYPILPELAEWFEEAIAECSDIENIEVTSMTVNGVKYSREVSVEAQVLAYRLLKEKLKEKAEEFARFGVKDA